MEFTITLPLTPENLEKVKSLFPAEAVMTEEKPKKKAAKKKEAAPEPVEPATETASEPMPTKADLRAVALAISKAGGNDQLKEVFSDFGSENLSGLKEEDYGAVYVRLCDIGEGLV